MKFLKKFLAITMIFACVLGFSGCGNKDLRIFEEDITAVVNGEKQELFYAWLEEHTDGVFNAFWMDSPSSVYSSSKDHAKTISGTSHDVTLTFAKLKPIFREEDVRFMTIGDDAVSYGEDRAVLPVTDFQSKKGELSFHFEIKRTFPKQMTMLCIAIWYDYDHQNIFIPMILSPELIGDDEFDSEHQSTTDIYDPPQYRP